MATDIEDRRGDLAQFANAAGQLQQPVPPGHALVRPTTGLADRVIGAQHVAVYRDEAKILQKLAALAAAAGTDWFYRFPVKSKDGRTDYIEGPSIKLANDVARIFGNNVNEVRELDNGDSWTFYARFTDIETGFSMERAYRQRKSQTSIKTRDADRQLDQTYQIGQSKAIRNCIVNALQIYADYAFEHARNSLVDKIGKDLDGYRKRVVEGVARIPVALNRVERVIGRAAKDWLAPDIAQAIAMMKSIADGMASVDDMFPPIEQAQPAASTASATPPSAESGPEAAGEAQGGATPNPPRPAPAPDQGRGQAADADVVEVAYKRGVAWRTQGGQRKAMPPEYRDLKHSREAVAWGAGFDGQPMPVFSEQD
jgi:hypothetical protein